MDFEIQGDHRLKGNLVDVRITSTNSILLIMYHGSIFS
jgi:predicted RNA-binding protein Jag